MKIFISLLLLILWASKPISISITCPNLVCVGDTLEVAASADNGTPPYHYHWQGTGFSSDDSFFKRRAALGQPVNYTVTVTDAFGNTGKSVTQYILTENCN